MSTYLFNNIKSLSKTQKILSKLIQDSDTNKSIYGQAITAKDGSIGASFNNGSALFSSYNPNRDVDKILSDVCIEELRNQEIFFMVEGLGSAQHIIKLINFFPNARILAVEKNIDSLNTLFNQFDFSFLFESNRFYVCDLNHLSECLLNYYIPSLFPQFKYISIRSWEVQNQETSTAIKETFKKTLKIISADFSVQAHFGKLWTRNILHNLQTAANLPTREFEFPIEKTACVVAAGPSLENHIEEIKRCRDRLYIIAVDTAFQILKRHGITTDAIITIDGQNISYLHFFLEIEKDTIVVADLCASATILRKITKHTNNILFTQSAHPLSVFASEFQASIIGENPFLQLDVSSGTVTGTALDFAQKVGFLDIVLLGADFAYIGGKTYAKASYLDDAFNARSKKLNSLETEFCTLMYRTTLIECSEGFSTEILLSYKQRIELMIDYLKKNNLNLKIMMNEITAKSYDFEEKKTKKQKKSTIKQKTYLYLDFKCRFIKYMENPIYFDTILPCILPLVAWLRNQNTECLKNISELFSVAKSKLERYIYYYD